MISVEELLKPINGANPSGENLRYTPVYDSVREARREDDDLDRGDWKRELKVADLSLVTRVCAGALGEKSKDLQIAAWLTDALLRKEGFTGLLTGLALCRGLIEGFWETLYPEIDEGDLEMRAAPLGWMGTTLDGPVRKAALTRDGYNFYQHKQSRLVGYEDQAKDNTQKKARDKMLADGKLAPEVFDKSFGDTPKAFYVELQLTLEGALKEVGLLTSVCDEKFVDSAPAFGRLRTALEEVRDVVHGLLLKKRETDPDPVITEPIIEALSEASADNLSTGNEKAPEAGSFGSSMPARYSFSISLSSESPARRELVAAVAASAAVLRQREPLSPAAYLMMRGLRWGDLRMAAALSDPAMLEAPPSEIRQHIKRLALEEKWSELLDAAESVMELPCSRAWLDLQRFVVEACVALGSAYDTIAIAIRSELRCLLRDVPQLLTATLMDETPAANDETRVWLREILAEPGYSSSGQPDGEPSDEKVAARWRKKFVDSSILAKEALRAGEPHKAMEIMQQEINHQHSARGRFQRRLQFVEVCVAAGKEEIVQPIVEDLIATIDAHKLEDWEDKSVMAAALVVIVRASKKIQADAKEKQKFFERVCRLDPVQALNY